MADALDLPIGVDDAEIVGRVLEGDAGPFAELVERYRVPLYRYAVSLVLNHDVAADMVQDAFVRAYTSLASCRDHTRFRPWLFQTLRHRCLDYLRDVRRRHVPLEDAGPVEDPAEPADARVERAELRTEITQALEALPDAQREAFLMHYVEGVAYEEMADRLETSVSALKMRVLRAREALASRLRNREVTRMHPVRLTSRRG